MITLHLYGKYRRMFGGKTVKLFVNSLTSAIRLMEANYPGKFSKSIADDMFYVIRGEKIGNHVNLDETMLQLRAPEGSHFHLIPKAIGDAPKKPPEKKVTVGGQAKTSKNSASTIRKKGLGVALLGAAILGISAVFGFAPGIYAGISLILGGASLMLTRDIAPKDEDPTSYSFNGPINTAEQGTPRPLIYGEVIAGSKVGAGSIRSVNQGANGTTGVTGIGGTLD